MTILIANIGTSDLSVKLNIGGESYYLPLVFLESEPNLKQQQNLLPPNLLEIWRKQSQHIQDILYPELNLPPGEKQLYRNVTKLLVQHYDQFQFRLSFGRIMGVIERAYELGAKTAYIFVTNQESEEKPQGHEKDTIFLYQLLEKSCWQKYQEKLELKCQLISPNLDANHLESMLDFYGITLEKIRQIEQSRSDSESDNKSDNNLVLVSVKGGTRAMGTALQLPAMDAGFHNLVFIDPELSLQRILDGKNSECKLTIYWRQLHSQKYRTVCQLLQRWDFEGVTQVLTDWQTSLAALPHEVKPVNFEHDFNNTLAKINSAIAAAQVGVCFFNLDRAGAKKIIDEHSWPEFTQLETEYSSWLNIYEQCRIYWELNQVANCLARMTSFWEESICVLILGLGGEKYFVGNSTDWALDKSQVEEEIWNLFAKKERCKNTNFKDRDFEHKPYPLFNRFSKQRFAEAMINFQINFQNKDSQIWPSIKDSLTKLNYWVECRNNLIHRNEGISKATMQAMLESDRATNKPKTNSACEPEDIVTEMNSIRSNILQLLGKETNLSGVNSYYIYSDVKQKILTELQFESK